MVLSPCRKLIQKWTPRCKRSEYEIQPRCTQRIPCNLTIEGQLDVVGFAFGVFEDRADVVTEIALDFQDERGRSPLGIVGLPAQQLARERVHTRRSLAGPDAPENRHAV